MNIEFVLLFLGLWIAFHIYQTKKAIRESAHKGDVAKSFFRGFFG